MDYLSVYKSIIRKSKSEQKLRLFNKKNKLEYYEDHHVIPKSIMLLRKPWLENNRKKSNLMNQPWNRVLLTTREHFLVHRCLAKLCEKLYGPTHQYTYKMFYVIEQMLNTNTDSKYKVTSTTYGCLKRIISIRGRSEETKKKHSASISGKNHWSFGIQRPESTRKKMRIYHGKNSKIFGTKQTIEHSKKIGKALTGKTHTEEHRRNNSIAQKEFHKKKKLQTQHTITPHPII